MKVPLILDPGEKKLAASGRRLPVPPLGLVVVMVAVTQGTMRMGLVPFFPELRETFGVGNTEVGFLFSAFALATLALQPLVAIVADRVGSRLLLSVAMSGLAVSALFFALAAAWEAAMAARLAMGVCGAMTLPAVFKLISREPPARQAGAFGAFEAGMGAASLMALSVAPVFARWLDLQGSYYVFIGIGLLAVLLLNRSEAGRTPPRPGKQAAADERPEPPRQSPYDNYGVPVRLVMLITMVSLAVLPIAGIMTWLPTYLQDAVGYTIAQAGLLMGVLTTISVPLAYLSGRWADGPASQLRISKIGAALLLISLLVLLLSARPGPALLLLIAVLTGCGIPMTFTPMMVVASQLFGPDRAGAAASTLTMTAQMSTIAAGAAFGWLIDMTGTFASVWLVGALCLLVRMAVIHLIGQRAVRPDAGADAPAA
ncbi:MAG: MFS transporter [Thermaerobacterales bacterium]